MRHMKNRIVLAVMLLVVVIFASACGKGGKEETGNKATGKVITEETAKDLQGDAGSSSGQTNEGTGKAEVDMDIQNNSMAITDVEMKSIRDIPSIELVTEMKAGWNLGNTLDSVPGKTAAGTAQHEMAWGNPLTSKEMIDLLKEAGFQVLRIPTTWKDHIVEEKDYLILENWMDRVQEVVDYGIDNDMYVILNLHHEDWHFPSYNNLEPAKKELARVWEQIAERFAGYDEHLIFEGMNEPRMNGTEFEWNGGTDEAWDVINQLNAVFVETIRKSGGNNSLRHLMIPAYAASSDSRVLRSLVIPDDDKIIVSVHAYAPYNFALNVKGTAEWDAEKASDTRDIDSLFNTLEDIFLSKDIPVIIGEFGAVNKENPDARKDWLAYYMEKAGEMAVPCIWWDNGAFEGDGENFGLMNRRELSWAFPELVEILTGSGKGGE